ncbi:FtsX-like permease family protein [Xylanimonas sp. McL0601]|uniref:FtsX-like permease family protein n=1 Tax=Xylanimonas sp. McL0601 TaxID=3414739 RepID=UPI003CEAE841
MANSGYPRPRALLVDGVRATLAQPVATAAALLVVALVCVVVMVTAGRTAATERQVLSTIDQTGTRLITVTDGSGNAGFAPDSVAVAAGVHGVSWALGLGPATDAVAGSGQRAPATAGVPLRDYVGTLPDDVTLVSGRLPQRPGEAVAGVGAVQRLGLTDGAGPVTAGRVQATVVGVVHARGALARLDETVLVTPDRDVPLRYLYVTARSAVEVPAVAQAVKAALHVDHPERLTVETSDAAMRLREVVSGRLGAASRQLTAAVLAVGVVVVGVTMLGMVSARRRDFGRRRALGASRSVIVVLVLIHAGLAACAGAVLGTVVGSTVVAVTSRAVPSLAYVIALAALTVLAAMAGSVPPALLAARRDPVRILRVP